MKLDHAEKIADYLLDNFGTGEDDPVRTEYSGRSMYGRTTAAVVHGCPLEVAYAAGALGFAVDLRWDSMGRNYVVY